MVYLWVLSRSRRCRRSNRTTAVETWLALSNDAYSAGRYADALEPTSRLVARFPLQQAYAERLAHTFGKLNRPADEAAAWERFVDTSPTPIDACPAIGDAYTRAGQPQKSLEALQRCVSFDPRNSEQLFFLGLRHAGQQPMRCSLFRGGAIDPSDADILLGLGRLALREKLPTLNGQRTVLTRFPATPTRSARWTRCGATEPPARRPGIFNAPFRLRTTRPLRSDGWTRARAVAEARRHSARARVDRQGARRSLSGSSAWRRMRIVWSRAIAGVFWFATAGYCR
jgi:tetratricopeptide (TPR) repeat protein